MVYKTIKDLPDAVKNHLPQHAQEIYQKSFNNAWEEYQDPNKRRGSDSPDTVAHKVAWAAVEKKYHKNLEDKWVEK